MIFICGDPHGEYAQLLRSAESVRPAAVILLGDQTPEDDEILHRLDALAPVYFILGNHDGDRDAYMERHRWLMDAGRDLGGQVVNIDGIRVAGLGGVFRSKQVWGPPEKPVHRTRKELTRHTPRQTRFWGGPARKHWCSIWPEDYDRLSRMRADILVTHEAPETFGNGFQALGDLARAMGVRRHFHGHHHVSYSAPLPGSECVVEGVALGGVKDADGEILLQGNDRLYGHDDDSDLIPVAPG